MKIIRNLQELEFELCRMADIADGNTVVVYSEEVLFNMEFPTEPKPIYIYLKYDNLSGNGNRLSNKYPGIITKSMNSLSTDDHKNTFDIAYIEPDEMEHPMSINCLLNQIAKVDNPKDYETHIVNSNNKPCDLYCALWFCDDTWTCFLIATDKVDNPSFDYKDSGNYSKTEEMEDE